MANPVHLMPLRDGEGERAGTLLPWLARCPSAHGVPDRLPEPHPLPNAGAVVGGRGAPGMSWTPHVRALEAEPDLPLARPLVRRVAGRGRRPSPHGRSRSRVGGPLPRGGAMAAKPFASSADLAAKEQTLEVLAE